MPNHKGHRAPNGTWDEHSPHRRRQKAEAAARFREKHRDDPEFKKYQQEANQQYRQENANLISERTSARKFRWVLRITATQRLFRDFGLFAVSRGHFLRGSWLVVGPEGRRSKDVLESPETMEMRLRKMKAVL